MKFRFPRCTTSRCVHSLILSTVLHLWRPRPPECIVEYFLYNQPPPYSCPLVLGDLNHCLDVKRLGVDRRPQRSQEIALQFVLPDSRREQLCSSDWLCAGTRRPGALMAQWGWLLVSRAASTFPMGSF